MPTTNPPSLEGICDGKEFSFVSHPSDCGKAIFCFQETPIVRECPQGQIFDINTGRYVTIKSANPLNKVNLR